MQRDKARLCVGDGEAMSLAEASCSELKMVVIDPLK